MLRSRNEMTLDKKKKTRGNIKRGKGAGKYDIRAWTGKDGAQWLDAITEVN